MDVFIYHLGKATIRYCLDGVGVSGLLTYAEFMEALRTADPKLWEMQLRAHEIKIRDYEIETAAWREAGALIGAADCVRMNEQNTKYHELIRGKYAAQRQLYAEELEALREEAKKYLATTYL